MVQIRSFKRIRFFIDGLLSLFNVCKFAPTRYITVAIVPASMNTRSDLFRNREFEKPLVFLIVSMSPANQSKVWLIEEKYLPEYILSLFEYSKPKASPAEMADEPIKASTKYAKRKNFIHFFSIWLYAIEELYHRINISAIVCVILIVLPVVLRQTPSATPARRRGRKPRW